MVRDGPSQSGRGKRTSTAVNDRQNGVHESIDGEGANGQSNVYEKLMPALRDIALYITLVLR